MSVPSWYYACFVLFLTRFSTKILVIRLVNGGRAGGRAYPKWRQTEVSAQ